MRYLPKIAPGSLPLEPRLPHATAAMPIIEFVDSNGVNWRVWQTVPTSRTSVSGEFENGWLTFESASGRKRLAPVPSNWDAATPERLEMMCRAATDVARRSNPVTGPAGEAGRDTA